MVAGCLVVYFHADGRASRRATMLRRMSAHFSFPAQIDLGQPLQGDTARLQARLQAPLRVLQAHLLAEVGPLLERVEQAAREGHWCVGGLRYEAASGLRPELDTAPAEEGPLAWFAVYPAPQADALVTPAPASAEAASLPTLDWQPDLDRAAFAAGLQAIHAGIAAGQYYQINYTQQLRAEAARPVEGAALFAALQQAQPGGYALYLDMGGEQVASVSPELFFDWHQPATGSGPILTRPMKGTAARGATPQQDAAQAQHLQTAAKERAERRIDEMWGDVPRN